MRWKDLVENHNRPLTELFDTPIRDGEVTPISAQEAAAKFNIHSSVKSYAFRAGDYEFIVFFTQYHRWSEAKQDLFVRRGWYNCNFARKSKYGSELYFDLTGNSDAFKVFRYVIEAIRAFLAEVRPVTIACEGYVRRQGKFYDKLARMMQGALPRPYFWAKDGHSTLITRSRAVVGESVERDPVQQIIDYADFDEEELDSGSSQYCGTMALALQKVLNHRGIPNQIVLVTVGENGHPLQAKGGGVFWRHVAVQVGDAYYDMHGKNTAADLFSNYLWNVKTGAPMMFPVTALQLKDILRETSGSYSSSLYKDWGSRLSHNK